MVYLRAVVAEELVAESAEVLYLYGGVVGTANEGVVGDSVWEIGGH